MGMLILLITDSFSIYFDKLNNNVEIVPFILFKDTTNVNPKAVSDAAIIITIKIIATPFILLENIVVEAKLRINASIITSKLIIICI